MNARVDAQTKPSQSLTKPIRTMSSPKSKSKLRPRMTSPPQIIRGYKVLEPDFTDAGFQFKVGETYDFTKVPEGPISIWKGFTCDKFPYECMDHWEEGVRYVEVEAWGEIEHIWS